MPLGSAIAISLIVALTFVNTTPKPGWVGAFGVVVRLGIVAAFWLLWAKQRARKFSR
jgi:hypothetical protein